MFLDFYNLGKYNKGKRKDGVWVFGGVERGSNRCFAVKVKDRKAYIYTAYTKNLCQIRHENLFRLFEGLQKLKVKIHSYF